MTDVLMPRLSDSMQEGTVLTWLVADGDPVRAGQELAEIETDKATMTYEAEDDGTLQVVVAAGSTVAVGEVIARVGDAASAPSPSSSPDPASGAPSPSSSPDPASGAPSLSSSPDPASGAPSPSSSADPGTPAPAGPSTNGAPAPSGPSADGAPADPRDPEHGATPMARRIAAVHGISLAALVGSGPRGRVVRADVERAAGITPSRPVSRTAAPAPVSVAAPATASGGAAAGEVDPGTGDERVAPSRLQALIARRMAEAKATIPHFQVETEVVMDAALAFRAQLKAAVGDARPPSLNDLIVKASALALRDFPRANGSYVDGGFVLRARVNVGIAVAADDALVVPVIHDADTLTLGRIAAVAAELAAAVRDGTVTPPQLSGPTFTVSNLGMFGMTAITPVINPPQAAILGVGAIRETLARDDSGAIVDRRLLTLRLSCDHRILYGADAARFLGAIRDRLQAPASLAL